MSALDDRLRDILRACPTLMGVMAVARDLDLSDWLIFSGAIYQPVWNHLTGRPIEYGIKDYDLAYFDAADTSWDAEDVVIRRVAAAFASPLRERIEVRNQARVHLWFEDHFGEPYAPLSHAADAIGRFASPACAVGARLEADDRLTIIAPFGLEDVFALRLRPNPRRRVAGFDRIVAGIRSRWPEIIVET
jgi:hypothetical protein